MIGVLRDSRSTNGPCRARIPTKYTFEDNRPQWRQLASKSDNSRLRVRRNSGATSDLARALHRMHTALLEFDHVILSLSPGVAIVSAPVSRRGYFFHRPIIDELLSPVIGEALLFRSMLDDIREQRDRWQQQAERLAALAITGRSRYLIITVDCVRPRASP